jgi:hypothetical protein
MALTEPSFTIHFAFEGKQYRADLQHVSAISKEEKEKYHVEPNGFLVQLQEGNTTTCFDMHVSAIAVTGSWRTHAYLAIDPKLVQQIGDVIESHFE